MGEGTGVGVKDSGTRRTGIVGEKEVQPGGRVSSPFFFFVILFLFF